MHAIYKTPCQEKASDTLGRYMIFGCEYNRGVSLVLTLIISSALLLNEGYMIYESLEDKNSGVDAGVVTFIPHTLFNTTLDVPGLGQTPIYNNVAEAKISLLKHMGKTTILAANIVAAVTSLIIVATTAIEMYYTKRVIRMGYWAFLAIRSVAFVVPLSELTMDAYIAPRLVVGSSDMFALAPVRPLLVWTARSLKWYAKLHLVFDACKYVIPSLVGLTASIKGAIDMAGTQPSRQPDRSDSTGRMACIITVPAMLALVIVAIQIIGDYVFSGIIMLVFASIYLPIFAQERAANEHVRRFSRVTFLRTCLVILAVVSAWWWQRCGGAELIDKESVPSYSTVGEIVLQFFLSWAAGGLLIADKVTKLIS